MKYNMKIKGVSKIFEDLKYKQTQSDIIKELEKSNKKAKNLLHESSTEIKRLENENQIMDRKYNQVYQDARRMAGILTGEIEKDRLDEICKEQEDLEKILQDANILDNEDD